MRTLVDVLRDIAPDDERGITFVRSDGTEHHHSYARIWREVRRRAGALVESGLGRGERVALALPEPDDFVLTFFAAIAAGAVPVPLYPPRTLAKLDTYLASLRGILDSSGAALLVTSPQALPALGNLGAVRTTTTAELASATHVPDDAPVHPRQDELAFLQFTSGSTSHPKGVIVTHANLAANAHAIMFDGLRADPAVDKGVSWLPLYHDMGLIGFVIAPLFAKVPVVLMPTTSFIRRPSSWLDAMHRHRGTITFAPNFAFALATQAIGERHMAGWDLSCVRALGCGAEPIDAPTIRGFLDKFAPVGLKKTAILPSYGMAEATLAVTFGGLAEELRTDVIDADALREGRAVPAAGAAPTVEVVSCGRWFPSHEIAIAGEDGLPVAERHVGEITLTGPSVAQGYFGNAEATAHSFRAGRLHTGDLGYVAGGELFVCGRSKDVIIIHGRNYFPQDLEKIVSDVDGVRSAQVAVFAVPAPGHDAAVTRDERLVVVAEARQADGDEAAALRRAVASAVYEQVGLRVDDVCLIRRGTLPKTSSGKVRRRETRARFLTNTLNTPAGSEE